MLLSAVDHARNVLPIHLQRAQVICQKDQPRPFYQLLLSVFPRDLASGVAEEGQWGNDKCRPQVI
jgi:hypothetical protein